MIASFNSNAVDQDLVWRARGLQAIDRIEELNPKIQKATGKKKQELICEFNAERSYLAFASKEGLAIVKQRDEKRTWRILMFGEKSDFTQVSLVFDDGNQKATAWKVPSLTKGWQVLVLRSTSKFFLIGGGCSYLMDPDEPLKIVTEPQD